MKYRIDFTRIPWEEPIKGLRFKAAVQDGTKIRLAEFSKDFIEEEWCLKGHTGYMLKEGWKLILMEKKLFLIKEMVFISLLKNNLNIKRRFSQIKLSQY